MGRNSRLRKERREGRRKDAMNRGRVGQSAKQTQANRIRELEDRLREVSDGEFEAFGDAPPEIREPHLEDVLAFESVGSGISLFQGLEAHGVNLPPPDELDEQESAKKILEVMHALTDQHVILVGYEQMAPREFYSTLWNETLWEGCYIERREPNGLTFIDVSHSMSKADWRRFMEEQHKSDTTN